MKVSPPPAQSNFDCLGFWAFIVNTFYHSCSYMSSSQVNSISGLSTTPCITLKRTSVTQPSAYLPFFLSACQSVPVCLLLLHALRFPFEKISLSAGYFTRPPHFLVDTSFCVFRLPRYPQPVFFQRTLLCCLLSLC